MENPEWMKTWLRTCSTTASQMFILEEDNGVCSRCGVPLATIQYGGRVYLVNISQSVTGAAAVCNKSGAKYGDSSYFHEQMDPLSRMVMEVSDEEV